MREIRRSDGNRLARLALLVTGTLALAGCASGYSFVQPGAAGAGDYYTGDGTYSAPGYSYDAGMGTYDPYDAGFGYGSVYGPSFTFGMGFGSACGWNCADPYGGWPWYYGVGYYRGRHHRHHHHGDPVVSSPSPRPRLHPDPPRVPPFRAVRDAASPIAVPERSMEGLANRRMPGSALFAPRGVVRMRQPASIRDRPAYAAPQPSAFDERPIRMPAPHDLARPAARTPAPMHMAPVRARSNQTPSPKIR